MGTKIVFDNLDVYVQVHDMTEEFQNQDLHWVSSMATENRVTSSLSNEAKAEESLSKMENCLFYRMLRIINCNGKITQCLCHAL